MTYARYLLRQKGVQQKHLAAWLGINPGRVSLVLSGRDAPSASEERKLEDFFCLPIGTLLSKYEQERLE